MPPKAHFTFENSKLVMEQARRDAIDVLVLDTHEDSRVPEEDSRQCVRMPDVR